MSGIAEQYDADLADLSSISKNNDGFKYLLVIDVFSRHLWVQALKSKTAAAMVSALTDMFSVAPTPRLLRTDKGGEFVNGTVSKFFKNHNIHHFVTENEPKANYSERVIKTLKSKITKYLSWKQSSRYIDVLRDIVNAYNNTYHSSIKMAPVQVNADNQRGLWWMLYWPKKIRPRKRKSSEKTKPYKYEIGARVRISLLKGKSTREYDEKWSGEIFEISERRRRDGINVYKIKDYYDEPVSGHFYEEELQAVRVEPDKL